MSSNMPLNMGSSGAQFGSGGGGSPGAGGGGGGGLQQLLAGLQQQRAAPVVQGAPQVQNLFNMANLAALKSGGVGMPARPQIPATGAPIYQNQNPVQVPSGLDESRELTGLGGSSPFTGNAPISLAPTSVTPVSGGGGSAPVTKPPAVSIATTSPAAPDTTAAVDPMLLNKMRQSMVGGGGRAGESGVAGSGIVNTGLSGWGKLY